MSSSGRRLLSERLNASSEYEVAIVDHYKQAERYGYIPLLRGSASVGREGPAAYGR